LAANVDFVLSKRGDLRGTRQCLETLPGEFDVSSDQFERAMQDRRQYPAVRALLLSVAVVWAGFAAHPVRAQETAPREVAAPRASDDSAPVSSSGYVNPFPEGDTYKVQVYGDGFAEGLHEGLIEAFGTEPRLAIAKKHRAIGALIRSEFEEDLKAEEASRDVVHIGVLMVGLNDRDRIRMPGGGKSIAQGSEEWLNEYGRRVDRWIKTLKKRGVALYVVGQPPLRRQDANREAETITEVMREKAYLNGVRFIDLQEGFTEDGAFTQWGPDISGNRVKLRDGDGVTFTGIGNRKLAHYVEREMRRDITQAKTERVIPLAGADAEQRKINPGKVTGAGAQTSAVPAKGAAAREARLAQAKSTVAPVVPQVPVDTSNDQKADNTRLSLRLPGPLGKDETVQIDIVRPTIPAAVIALLTRKEVAERAAQLADAPGQDIAGGVTIVNSVSLVTDATGSPARRRAAAGQTATFTVLVKGERLAAKPGRSDDFAWPRPLYVEPVVPNVVSNPGAAKPVATPRASPRSTPSRSSSRG
jgi:uncharacterized protein